MGGEEEGAVRVVLMAVCSALAIALVRANERAREAEEWARVVQEQAVEWVERAAK